MRKFQMAEKGLIFDFQGFSVHDGPGCRTVIFFKGCPLNCRWCCNPEGISAFPELMYYKSRCRVDLDCVIICPSKAINFNNERILIDRKKCRDCLDHPCVKTCTHNALSWLGEYCSLEELMVKLKRDRQYWGSRGGVTLSGGEPMFQFEFVHRLLKNCYDSYMHTAMETCGFAPWKQYEQVIPFLEWIFFDLKHLDDQTHKSATGVGNKLILENARRLAEAEKDYRLVFRLPLVKEFNDSPEHLSKIVEFLHQLGKTEINLLPQHHLGNSKYSILDLPYSYPKHQIHEEAKLSELADLFAKNGVTAYLGSDTPF